MPVPRVRTAVASAVAVCLAGLVPTAALAQPAGVESSSTIVRTLKDPRITESSGLARSRYNTSRLWTHNDSGGGGTIYAIGPSGRTTATYELANARHWDWEAMASARRGPGRLPVRR